MKVRWTEQALARLAEIEEFIAPKNPTAAVALITCLIERGDALGTLWRRGRRLPELPGSALRELIEGNYRIVYRQRAGAIEVLTVFEAHRLLPVKDLGE